jgi:putative aldouronate transport system permease protein
VRLASLIKYAVMIVASLPLLIIYPFLQRFFTQGVLIGSVKG